MQEVHLSRLAVIGNHRKLQSSIDADKWFKATRPKLARGCLSAEILRRFCGRFRPQGGLQYVPKMYLFQVIGHLSKGQLLISCKIITGSAPHSFSATMPHPTNQNTMDDSKVYGDWRDELFQNGYVVIKNAIPKERCNHYIEKMFQWLESFPFGFDRNDRSTWTDRHLPEHIKGGMYHGYRVQHERFMWEARS